MKKILMALAMTGFTYFSAEAQTTQNEVCRRTPQNGVSCYKTKYAENFKVCKGYYGYFICGETPSYANSTHPKYQVYYKTAPQYVMQDDYVLQSNNTPENNTPATTPADMIAPQSQSYPTFAMSNSNTYEGYYTKKNYIKACYGGDNVAENNRNPYRGCPSPQDDGPAVNNERNVNESAPFELPPISGRIHD